MGRRLALLALFATFGCGRSSTGKSPFDCPADQLNPDGTCGPHFDGSHDFRDGGDGGDAGDGGDGGDGGDAGNCDFLTVSQCLAASCGAPGCCDCSACAAQPACAGDMGDFCADPAHCPDPRCVGDPRCHVLGTEICNNCIDDNHDGLIDCADPQCVNFPGCEPGHTCPNPPVCTDPTCACGPICKNLVCMPSVDFGTINPRGSSSTRMVDTTGTRDVTITPCAPGGAGMVVGQFTLSGGPTAVKLTFSQGAGEDHVFGIFSAGTNQTCGANPIRDACYDPKSALMGSHTYVINDPGLYYVIIQPFEPAGQGPATVTLSTSMLVEICNNGIDDDLNGLIDCADPACFNAPNCINQMCRPDAALGDLVVNAPGKSASFDTTGSHTTNNVPTCQAQVGGGDRVLSFTLRETAGILLNWNQLGDHVVALAHLPPAGEKCDAQLIGCYDPSGRTNDLVAWGEFPPGDYEFIFKATRPGQEGPINATVSAYRNRRVEICHNGIDDDGNGLIDCADPACFGVQGCTGPYCMPNVDFGGMGVGQSMSTTLDVKANGILGYTTSCARGGGKGMVVRLTVPSPGPLGGIGITFDCSQPLGDHVIDLFPAGGPRDICDFDQTRQVCADPKTLPFGCGYEIPNVEPGTYNVIVEAFQAGSEGTVNLTLGVVDDRLLEICNNGIDDDMNGFTDCADRKCATSPFCTRSQCRPDATIDPMPLNGSNVFKLVQTASNGVHATVPCATQPGGQTATLLIRLTAKANLNLAWNQIGNHDFALFSDDGPMLACDAGTLLACGQSAGATTGMLSFTNVPAGRYYLVVAGDKPDGTVQSSGAVNVGVSGLPAP